jgi:DNA-3-methyladenine glycosylase II
MTHEAIQHLSKVDKQLAKLIAKVGEYALKPDKRRSPYQALIKSVAYQQLNGIAAGTIFGRFKNLYPGTTFPSPQQVLDTPVENLRKTGLSAAKVKAIQDIAAKTIEGIVPDRRTCSRLSDAELVERLTQIRGVGPWTVQMFLMFTLGRMDVLPIGDFGVRKGFSLAYGLDEMPTPGRLAEIGEKWRPYRTVASWYMWQAVDIYGKKATST